MIATPLTGMSAFWVLATVFLLFLYLTSPEDIPAVLYYAYGFISLFLVSTWAVIIFWPNEQKRGRKS